MGDGWGESIIYDIFIDHTVWCDVGVGLHMILFIHVKMDMVWGTVLLSPQAKQGGFLYFTRFVFFYKIGEGMNTACKSVTFAAEI